MIIRYLDPLGMSRGRDVVVPSTVADWSLKEGAQGYGMCRSVVADAVPKLLELQFQGPPVHPQPSQQRTVPKDLIMPLGEIRPPKDSTDGRILLSGSAARATWDFRTQGS